MTRKPPDPAAMQRAAGRACDLLKTLAHPDRLMLVCQLAHAGEMTVGELEKRLGVRQPMLSQQLGALRKQALVDTRREGKHIYYRVRPGPAVAMLEALYEEFCRKARKR